MSVLPIPVALAAGFAPPSEAALGPVRFTSMSIVPSVLSTAASHALAGKLGEPESLICSNETE